jgi:hypothetical protein
MHKPISAEDLVQHLTGSTGIEVVKTFNRVPNPVNLQQFLTEEDEHVVLGVGGPA